MNPKPLLVTAALIQRDEKILIARRRLTDKVEAGKWEFPGGKVEFGERPEDCLVREIKEELDLDVSVEKLFDVASHVYDLGVSKLHVVLVCYLCHYEAGEMRPVHVEEAKWVTRAELNDFDWAAADVPVVEKLLTLEA